MNQQEAKQIIRKRICEARTAIPSSDREGASKSVCQHVLALPTFKQAQFIGLYWPLKSEINTLPILEQSIALNKSYPG